MRVRHIYQSRRSPVVVFVTLAAALSVAAGPRGSQSQRDQQRPSKGSIQRVASFDALEPTTADEIALSKFFRGRGHAKLAEMDEVKLAIAVDYLPIPPRRDAPPNESASERNYRAKICSAATVFIGHVSGYQVRLTEGGTWLYTTYRVTPVAIAGSANRPSVISLSIASGTVDVAGKIVTTITLPLLIDGRHHLIYANRIPGNSGYVPVAVADEVSWPANTDLLTRLDRITQIADACGKEPRSPKPSRHNASR